MRQACLCGLLIAATVFAAACDEAGTVTVRKLSFNGVKAVDESLLKNTLATQTSSKLPWGKKRYFDRARFDADLARVRAFYADRGYPDARVTSFDVKLNAKQDEVDLTVTISEGEPIKVAALNFSGFDIIPTAHLDELKKNLPLKPGQPRDRQLVVIGLGILLAVTSVRPTTITRE